jgi:hypothetical protein
MRWLSNIQNTAVPSWSRADVISSCVNWFPRSADPALGRLVAGHFREAVRINSSGERSVIGHDGGRFSQRAVKDKRMA